MASRAGPPAERPGEFDFYVLALSWSPSFCEAAAERGNSGRSHRSSASGRYSFVVHGLWPQYERGFPEYCQRPSPRLDRNIMTSMLDLMPAPGLIFNEWDKHGTCSGLGARAYFETIRKARAAVKIPEEFLQLSEPKTDRAGRSRGGLHQDQSGPEQFGDFGDLRQPAPERSADLPEQGHAIPRLRGNRPPRLPPRRSGDAAGAGRVKILFRHAKAIYQGIAAASAQTAQSCLRSRSSTALLSSARYVDGRDPSTPKLRQARISTPVWSAKLSRADPLKTRKSFEPLKFTVVLPYCWVTITSFSE